MDSKPLRVKVCDTCIYIRQETGAYSLIAPILAAAATHYLCTDCPQAVANERDKLMRSQAKVQESHMSMMRRAAALARQKKCQQPILEAAE